MSGKKRFSQKVMEFELKTLISEGMYKALVAKKKSDGESHSNYVRTLIMKDLNIDYNGKKTNPR